MVFMENDVASKAVGTVKMKLYDGIMHTFNNVQHALDLWKNLIYLGTLEENGFTYSSKEVTL